MAIAFNPEDAEARLFLEERLLPGGAVAELFPDPFSPPPLHGEVGGQYRVGHVEGQPDNQFGLTDEEICLNILVFGEQGFGKTMFLKALLVAILENGDG